MQALWKTTAGQVLKRLSVEFLYYLAVLFLGILFSPDKKQRPMHKLEHKYLLIVLFLVKNGKNKPYVCYQQRKREKTS